MENLYVIIILSILLIITLIWNILQNKNNNKCKELLSEQLETMIKMFTDLVKINKKYKKTKLDMIDALEKQLVLEVEKKELEEEIKKLKAKKQRTTRKN